MNILIDIYKKIINKPEFQYLILDLLADTVQRVSIVVGHQSYSSQEQSNWINVENFIEKLYKELYTVQLF